MTSVVQRIFEKHGGEIGWWADASKRSVMVLDWSTMCHCWPYDMGFYAELSPQDNIGNFHKDARAELQRAGYIAFMPGYGTLHVSRLRLTDKAWLKSVALEHAWTSEEVVRVHRTEVWLYKNDKGAELAASFMFNRKSVSRAFERLRIVARTARLKQNLMEVSCHPTRIQQIGI